MAQLSDLIDELDEQAEQKDSVSLGDLLDGLDGRTYGPLLLLPALISISPLGAIPGMSLITGGLIVVLAGQMLCGLPHPWTPRWLRDRAIPSEKIRSTVNRGRPWVKRVEKLTRTRMAVLTHTMSRRLIAAICILLAVSFFPLAIVPFGVFAPGVAIALFALGLTARDGYLVLAAYAACLVVGLLLTGWLS